VLHSFASSSKIQNYLSRVVKSFSLRTHIEFYTVVEKCIWDEQRRKWLVDTRCEGIVAQGREADIVINVVGIFNHYQNPEIPALETFTGIMMHATDWDHTVDLAGNKVPYTGVEASASQAVPKIQPLVKELSKYIRSPT
jgi:cation diffusion facilitator CzcD-associated flavoprotein CzcO